MDSSRGIGVHLQKFEETELRNSDTPSPNLLTSIKSLLQILEEKSQSLATQSSIHAELEGQITYAQANKIKQQKQQIKQNEKLIKILQACNFTESKIDQYAQCEGRLEWEVLTHKFQIFKQIYLSIGKIQEFFVGVGEDQGESQQQDGEGLAELKKEYFGKLNQQLYSKMITNYYTQQKQQSLQQSLHSLSLPKKSPKKSANSPHPLPSPPSSPSPSCPPQHNPIHSLTILQSLLNEFCCYCLQKKIQIVLDREDEEPVAQRISYIVENGEFQVQGFRSLFFTGLWNRVCKSVGYIFLTPNSQVQGTAYQIQEPNWLFQYLEDYFSATYKFLFQELIPSLPVPSSLSSSLSSYMVSYNLSTLFQQTILTRLQVDLSCIRESEKNSPKDLQLRKRNNFLIFNFLDQVYMLSQRLTENYQTDVALVEEVLICGESAGLMGIDVLARAFDYQHQWIEDRIFNDFSNINYSNISNLKNMEAYNITVNFTHIFEKLYSKYRKISTPSLKNKIHEFYNGKILNLVRHIITSFERIYNHSHIDRYHTLISYKKVEDQFRMFFQGFIAQMPSFQVKIADEYYGVLAKYVDLLALEQLTPIHKKIYKRLSDNNDFFITDSLCSQNLSTNKAKWTHIFQSWHEKLNKIGKLQPNYEDKKLRNIFFVFVESIQFSQDGFLYFISLFQPFLVTLFSVEETKVVKMLLEMEKTALNEYCQTHPNSLWFLSSSQIRSIKKSKIQLHK